MSRTVLVQPTYEALKERIMDRYVRPEAKLNIDALAADLKVSPTPVREALARLAAERLVSFTPFRGYAVMPLLTQQQLAQLFHVRRLLEVDAAKQGAQRVIMADLRAMERELQVIASLHPVPKFQGYGAYNQHDQKFHELVVGASGNQALLTAYQGLNLHAQIARLFLDRSLIDYEEACAEHRAILDNLSSHDAEGTVAAVLQHIDSVEHRLVDALEHHLANTS